MGEYNFNMVNCLLEIHTRKQASYTRFFLLLLRANTAEIMQDKYSIVTVVINHIHCFSVFMLWFCCEHAQSLCVLSVQVKDEVSEI